MTATERWGKSKMPKEPTLSTKLWSQLAIIDEEHDRELSSEAKETNAAYGRLIDFIVDRAINSRETITDKKLEPDVMGQLEHVLLNSKDDLLEYFLDDHFTRTALMSVSECVNRILQLSRLDSLRVPSVVTNGYLREATRTYIFGFPQASVALSRATLEQAIKETLGRQGHRDFISFQKLLEEARRCNVLDDAMERCASEVAKAGNDVMHERPTTLDEAFDVLSKLRGLLKHIYSAEGGF
jgi:hypothetical protein